MELWNVDCNQKILLLAKKADRASSSNPDVNKLVKR